MMKKPLVLCILDGCGIREEESDNAFKNASKPTFDYLLSKYPNSLLQASGKMVGFVNAIATDESSLRDEFFTDTNLHNPQGKYIMILSVAVLPEHRGQGLAKEMMRQLLDRQKEAGRQAAVLTCLDSKVEMYKKMGYVDLGISQSSWGGEEWHEMICRF